MKIAPLGYSGETVSPSIASDSLSFITNVVDRSIKGHSNRSSLKRSTTAEARFNSSGVSEQFQFQAMAQLRSTEVQFQARSQQQYDNSSKDKIKRWKLPDSSKKKKNWLPLTFDPFRKLIRKEEDDDKRLAPSFLVSFERWNESKCKCNFYDLDRSISGSTQLQKKKLLNGVHSLRQLLIY